MAATSYLENSYELSRCWTFDWDFAIRKTMRTTIATKSVAVTPNSSCSMSHGSASSGRPTRNGSGARSAFARFWIRRAVQ